MIIIHTYVKRCQKKENIHTGQPMRTVWNTGYKSDNKNKKNFY